MKNMKLMGQLLAAGIASSIFVACHSNDTTMSANDETATSATTAPANTNDTSSMINQPAMDTSSAVKTNPAAPATSQARETPSKAKTVKKKGKATVGTMTQNKSAKVQVDNSGVYEFSEVRPAYTGGQSALNDYITSHVMYPDQAVDNNTQGTVNVQFTVDENGNVKDAHVIGDKLGNGLDEEAVRVVSNMPKWSAGKVKGKTVKSKMTIPITFKIEEQ